MALSHLCPSGLNDTVRGFKFNDVRDFKQKIENNDKEIAAVIIEGARGTLPTKNFIEEIQNFCEQNKCLFITDELRVVGEVLRYL